MLKTYKIVIGSALLAGIALPSLLLSAQAGDASVGSVSSSAPADGSETSVRALFLEDLDADGLLDKLIAHADGSLAVAMNRGRAVFEPVPQALGRALPVSVLASDLNDDGYVDLYLVCDGPNVALSGDGTGSLQDSTRELGLGDAGPGRLAERVDLDGVAPLELVLHNDGGDVVFWPDQGTYRRDPDSTPALRAIQPPSTLASGDATALENRAHAPRTELDAQVTGISGAIRHGGGIGSGSSTSGTALVASPSTRCVPSLEDGATGNCLAASSVPTLGQLYPLGPEFNIDAAGRVGINTIPSDHQLEVVDTSTTSQISQLLKLASRSLSPGGDARLRFSLRNASGVDRFAEIIAAKESGGVNDNVRMLFRTSNNGSTVDALELLPSGTVRVPTSLSVTSSAGATQASPGQVDVRGASGTTGVSLKGSDVEHSIRVMDLGGQTTIRLNGSTGQVETKTLKITGGSDLAEPFEVTGARPEPGMVLSIDPAMEGKLCISTQPYDRKVAGIVSGANAVKPGMIMSQQGVLEGEFPVALSGRVYCLVDASHGAVEVGDLLTTSPTPGHAMKASDSDRAPGAVLGKALTSLPEGNGLVLVLVNLQ